MNQFVRAGLCCLIVVATAMGCMNQSQSNAEDRHDEFGAVEPTNAPEANTDSDPIDTTLVATASEDTASKQAVSEDSADDETALPEWRRIDPSRYVGSARCRECHEKHYGDWKETLHTKMVQPAISDGPNRTVVADFNQPSPHRTFELEDVKKVIGSRWKQRYIGEIDGREVVLPAQWSVRDQVWGKYGGSSDWWYPYHSDWKERSMFQLCDGCHATGADYYTQSFVERNIGCESCHGPGKAHSDEPLLDNIVNPARLSRDRSIDICLSCHLSGKPPGTDYGWPVGYEPGMDLSDFWDGSEPKEGVQTAEFWQNGTAHKNRVQGNTFLQSRMYHKGLQCTACHNPHGSRHRSMTIKSAHDNALCLMCHGPEKDPGPSEKTLTEHTHHEANSTGSLCVECHMPKTGKNAVAGESRNHTFDFISPAKTIEYGLPNSCNGCHADDTPEWALKEIEKWSDE